MSLLVLFTRSSRLSKKRAQVDANSEGNSIQCEVHAARVSGSKVQVRPGAITQSRRVAIITRQSCGSRCLMGVFKNPPVFDASGLPAVPPATSLLVKVCVPHGAMS